MLVSAYAKVGTRVGVSVPSLNCYALSERNGKLYFTFGMTIEPKRVIRYYDLEKLSDGLITLDAKGELKHDRPDFDYAFSIGCSGKCDTDDIVRGTRHINPDIDEDEIIFRLLREGKPGLHKSEIKYFDYYSQEFADFIIDTIIDRKHYECCKVRLEKLNETK